MCRGLKLNCTCIQKLLRENSNNTMSVNGCFFNIPMSFSPSSSSLTCRSAAMPMIWYEFGTPPTALFNALQRYPELTIIGRPNSLRAGSNICRHMICKFFNSFGPGVLIMPSRRAVVLRVISSYVKCSLRFMSIYQIL